MWKGWRKQIKYFTKSQTSQPGKVQAISPKAGLSLHEKQLYCVIYLILKSNQSLRSLLRTLLNYKESSHWKCDDGLPQ